MYHRSQYEDALANRRFRTAYAERVLRDVSIATDGHPLTPRFLYAQFPAVQKMKNGGGEIRIEFEASLPVGGYNRKLTFENHLQSRIAAYQVNCLAPRDPDFRILAQNRNYSQSFYQLDFTQAGMQSTPLSFLSLTDAQEPLGLIALLLFGWLALLSRRQV